MDHPWGRLASAVALAACSSSNPNLPVSVTTNGTLVDSSSAPVVRSGDTVCLVGDYQELAGSGYDQTACARFSSDSAGKFKASVVMPARLWRLNSSYVATPVQSCHFSGTVPTMLDILEGRNGQPSTATIDVIYTVTDTACK